MLFPVARRIRSKTWMPLNFTGVWKAYPMPFRARSVMDSSVMSCPSSRICPELGFSMPAISLARVDFPPPLGPVITIIRSSGIVRETSRMISRSRSSGSTLNDTFRSSSMLCSSDLFLPPPAEPLPRGRRFPSPQRKMPFGMGLHYNRVFRESQGAGRRRPLRFHWFFQFFLLCFSRFFRYNFPGCCLS